MVERMAPNHDIRVRFLEPLFAEISADFFSYIPLRAASSGAPAPVAELEYASDLKSEDFFVMRVQISPGALRTGNRMLIFLSSEDTFLFFGFFLFPVQHKPQWRNWLTRSTCNR